MRISLSEEVNIIKEKIISVAIDGIMTLGYSREKYLKVLNNLDINHMDTEHIIREVLRDYQNNQEGY